jgi:CRISPR system Cascade subunit CasB
MSQPPVEDRVRLEERFAAQLEALARNKDRGALARLRRGVGKELGLAGERDGWVISRVPTVLSDRRLSVFCLVASLFAIHPESGGRGSLGRSFAMLRERSGGDGPERRFVALLDSDREDLFDRLRHAITLLRSKDITVDWADLLLHVQHWDHPDRWVQVRWSRDFWGAQDHEQSETTTAPTRVPAQ